MGKVAMLEHVYAVGKGVGGVVGAHFAPCLKDDFATVNLFVDIVDAYTTLGVAGSKYRLVYVVSVHAGTTVSG